jgi:putative oligomerization/nucleic acid binding protein
MGLIRGVARTAVIAGTATAVSNRVSRRQTGRWAQQEQEQQQQEYQNQQYAAMQAQQNQPAAGDPMPGKIDQLKSLADLKAQGILTEQEFQAQKNAILNG